MSKERQKHIAIISHGASGTTALFDQLLNNKHVYQHTNKEPLNCKTSQYAELNSKVLNGKHWYNDHIRNYVKEAEAEDKILVIHVKPTEIPPLNVGIDTVIKTLSYKFNFVYIERDNYLSTVCSSVAKKLHKREIKQLATDYNFMPSKQIHLPVAQSLGRMQRIDNRHNTIRKLLVGHKYVHVSYEKDLNVDIRKTVDKITTEFGFYDDYEYTQKYNTYSSVKNRWSGIPFTTKLENYAEWEEALTGTDYEWMLKE